jgi:hypothetical protein
MNKIKWFLGFVAGDGSITKRYVRIYNNSESLISDCIKILQTKFKIPFDKIKIRKLRRKRKGFKRNKETVEIGINSTKFSKTIKNLIEENFKVPSQEILTGVFDAEGCVDLNGNIVLWQRKSHNGNKVFKAVKNGLKKYNIKYDLIGNLDFNILEICGGYKYYENLQKFHQKIGFRHEKKQKNLSLILEIFNEKRSIQINDIFNFIKNGKTVREVIEKFKIPKSRIYRILNMSVKKKLVEKINTFPNKYKLIGTL